MRTITRAVAFLVAVTVAVALPALPAGAGTADDESQFVASINQLRASKGVAPLQLDAELTGIARRWAAEMAEAGKISHNPDFAAWVTQDWVKLGENVGVGPDVPGLHQAFVDSPGHYRNLVDPEFTRIGVGVVRTADGTIFTSHQFMRLRADESAVSQPAPAPAPEPVPASEPAPVPAPAPVSSATPAAADPSEPATASTGAASSSAATAAAAAAAAPPPALDQALTGLRLLDAAA